MARRTRRDDHLTSLLRRRRAARQDAAPGPSPCQRALDPVPAARWTRYRGRAGSAGRLRPVAPLAALADGNQTNPDWSPDGQRFVFAMNDGKRDDLWVADADGSGARKLLDCNGSCRWLDDPDWSPDGNEIVYSRSIQRADGWGIGTLETVDVATGQVRVVLGPWKRDFTAGARYSPDGDQVVFEKVHKPGAPTTPTSTRSPSSWHASTARAPRSARSPTRGCSPRRPTGARTGRASCTPRSPSRTAKRRTFSGSAPGAENRRGSPTVPETGATPPIRPGCRTAPGCCSAAGSKGVGEPGAADRAHRRQWPRARRSATR